MARGEGGGDIMKTGRHQSIMTKLILVNLLLLMALGGIVTVDFFSSSKIENALISVIDQEVNHAIENAELGRKLHKIFADTQLLVRTFDEQEETLEMQGADLLRFLQESAAASAIVSETQVLRDALTQFQQMLQTLLVQCAQIIEILRAIRTVERDLDGSITTLDDALAELKMTFIAEGKEDELVPLEQLSSIIPDYHNVLLRIAIGLAASKQAYLDAVDSDAADHDHERNLLALLNEIKSGLIAAPQVNKDITALGQRLLAIVATYKEHISAFHQAMREFQTQLGNMKLTQAEIMTAMQGIDAEIVQSTGQIRANVSHNIHTSQRVTLMLSALVFLMLLVIAGYGIRMVQPLKQLARTAAHVAEGQINREYKHLRRHDEIGVLSNAFGEMQATIASVLQDLSAVSHAVQEGILTTRGQAETMTGGWRELVVGINQVLDAFMAPMTQINVTLERIAQGDLTGALETEYHGDFQTMMRQVQMMTTQLTDVVLNVKIAAQEVAQRSRELSDLAMQMSQGAAQQASATEEVSSSMEEMAANLRQTADSSKLAEQIARKSAEDAHEGKESVTEIIRAMAIIADRISVVQEIASQTNMLSLNATIEAAKAQDYGKGFTVVASSVRDLASQTRHSATEIRALVASCVTLSAQAGDVLERLVPNSQKTAELVQEISAASQEQSHGIDQVNRAVQQLDIVTQQNAGTSEELASTSETLTAQADALQKLMAFFTVREAQPVSQSEDDEVLRLLQGLEKDRLVALLASAISEKPVSTTAPSAPSDAVSHERHVMKNKPNAGGNDDLDNEFEHY